MTGVVLLAAAGVASGDPTADGSGRSPSSPRPVPAVRHHFQRHGRTTTADPITEQLKKLAQAEATAARERLAKRTSAARDFASAAAGRAEAQANWRRIQGEVDAKQSKAVAAVLDTDLKAAQVAELLGIDVKDVRTFKTAVHDHPARGN